MANLFLTVQPAVGSLATWHKVAGEPGSGQPGSLAVGSLATWHKIAGSGQPGNVAVRTSR
jgi:hypothetical protein